MIVPGRGTGPKSMLIRESGGVQWFRAAADLYQPT